MGVRANQNQGATGNNPGADNGGGAPNQGHSGNAGNSSTGNDWTSSLSDPVKGFIQTKGFKDVGQLAESYQNLERAIGAPKERVLMLPEKPDAPEWNDIYYRLGRPKTPEEYGFQKNENNAEFVDWAQKVFHENGLTKKQAETLTAKWNDLQKDLMTRQETLQANQEKEQKAQLQQEWGKAFEQNMKAARNAAVQFGMTDETVGKLASALGIKETFQLLHSISEKIGEPEFVSKDGNGNLFQGKNLTPAQARAKLDALRDDKDFTRRYLEGGVKEKAEMDALFQQAYPGETPAQMRG